MIQTDVVIPDDKRLRVCIDCEDDTDFCVETKLQWKRVTDKGCIAGLAFVHGDAPQRVASALGINVPGDEDAGKRKSGWITHRFVLRIGRCAFTCCWSRRASVLRK